MAAAEQVGWRIARAAAPAVVAWADQAVVEAEVRAVVFGAATRRSVEGQEFQMEARDLAGS